MSDFINIYIDTTHEFHGESVEHLGSYRNIKQVRYLFKLVDKIKEFVLANNSQYKLDCSPDCDHRLFYEILSTKESLNKQQAFLYNENWTDFNCSYHSDLISIISPENEKELTKQAESFIAEDPRQNNAHFDTIDIQNSLTRQEIHDILRKVFDINQIQLEYILFLMKPKNTQKLYK